jgi:Ion channel
VLNFLAAVGGVALIAVVLWEAFETIVLPRRVSRRVRLTRFFYRFTWVPWILLAGRYKNKKRRDALFSYYGPLSLLLLMALWAATLVVGFGLVHYGTNSSFSGAIFPSRLGNALYISGTTLFTLGLGDITPASATARLITVLEAGIGFGFFALVIGYLPVLYQAFSRREVTISLLDARAGTPPTAYELLRRHAGPDHRDSLTQVLNDWERWAADLMESHLSYPVLAYFRSQHDNQSWLSSLVAILDVCTLAIVGIDGLESYQAKMTFAIARHALVDLSQIFSAPPTMLEPLDRLTNEDFIFLRQKLQEAGFSLNHSDAAIAHLEEIRGLYEPFAASLARYLRLDLPPWIRREPAKDNWQTSFWQPKQMEKAAVSVADDHF